MSPAGYRAALLSSPSSPAVGRLGHAALNDLGQSPADKRAAALTPRIVDALSTGVARGALNCFVRWNRSDLFNHIFTALAAEVAIAGHVTQVS